MFEHRPLAVFASAGDEERRRRPADVATLVAAAVLVLLGNGQRTDPTPIGDNAGAAPARAARLVENAPRRILHLRGGLRGVRGRDGGDRTRPAGTRAGSPRRRWSRPRSWDCSWGGSRRACGPRLAGAIDGSGPRFPGAAHRDSDRDRGHGRTACRASGTSPGDRRVRGRGARRDRTRPRQRGRSCSAPWAWVWGWPRSSG